MIFAIITYSGYNTSMKEIAKTFPNNLKYDLNKLGNPEKILFFDIETTGLSPKNSNLYLIGCIHIGDEITFKQWFAQSLGDEVLLLQSFYSYVKDFDILIHFNGDSFDLPYIRECSSQYYLFNPLDKMHSVDIYKMIRYLKKPLNLQHMNQKSIEEYLGLKRKDIYTGGDLIDFYFSYLKSRDTKILDLLLLHNEEDLLGMLKVMNMLSFADFFNSDFSLSLHEISCDFLILQFISDEFIDYDLHLGDELKLHIAGNTMEVKIPILNAELKYFFSNYKDYYYLIIEDYAIHKSIGEFVSREVKKKATRQTAYIKKQSLFIPSFDLPINSFKSDYRAKQCYLELKDFDYSNEDFVKSYLTEILKYFRLLKQ